MAAILASILLNGATPHTPVMTDEEWVDEDWFDEDWSDEDWFDEDWVSTNRVWGSIGILALLVRGIYTLESW